MRKSVTKRSLMFVRYMVLFAGAGEVCLVRSGVPALACRAKGQHTPSFFGMLLCSWNLPIASRPTSDALAKQKVGHDDSRTCRSAGDSRLLFYTVSHPFPPLCSSRPGHS